jgi:hypothetical protein
VAHVGGSPGAGRRKRGSPNRLLLDFDTRRLGEEPVRLRKITGGSKVWPTHGPWDPGARRVLERGHAAAGGLAVISNPGREPVLERTMPSDAVPGSTIPEDSGAEVLLRDGSWTWCRVIGQRRDRRGRWCVGIRWYASCAVGGREGWHLLDRTKLRRPKCLLMLRARYLAPRSRAPQEERGSIRSRRRGAEPWVQEATMRLRRHRRNLVVWSQSAGPAGRYGAPPFTGPARTRRIRRCLRTGVLLTILGLMPLAVAVRARWRPVLAGVVLTAIGVMYRHDPVGVVLLPGLLFLVSAPLIPASPKMDRSRLSQLERELAVYCTPAQRCDVEAMLDRYPDDTTYELRDILARQAMAACNNQIPGAGRY